MAVDYSDKVEIKDVNIELKKILEDPNSELLFAVTVYKGQVVGSVNKSLDLTEDKINELVHFIVKSWKPEKRS